MSPADLPRYWRAVLTFHPEIGMFGGKRGAWKVHHSFEIVEPMKLRVWPVEEHEDGEATLMLYMDVPRQLRANTFANPATLLRALFTLRRGNAMKMKGDSMTTDTQRDQILKHLMACKPITPLEALHHFKCMRLGARIWELKQPKFGSHPISRRMKAMSSGKVVAEYYYDYGHALKDAKDQAAVTAEAQGVPA